jgi:hypothetical protein
MDRDLFIQAAVFALKLQKEDPSLFTPDLTSLAKETVDRLCYDFPEVCDYVIRASHSRSVFVLVM